MKNDFIAIVSWKRIALFVFYVGSIYFGYVRHESGDRCSLWEHARTQVKDDVYWLRHSDPYWNVFDPDKDPVGKGQLICHLANDASLYKAVWIENDFAYDVNYYKDRRGRCLMVWWDKREDNKLSVRPYGEWYFINRRGLVQWDWAKTIGNLWFVLALFLLPWIGILKV